MKSEPSSLRFGRFLHHPPQDVCDGADLLVVKLNGLGKLTELLDRLPRSRNQSTEMYEGAHDLDIHARRGRRTQNA